MAENLVTPGIPPGAKPIVITTTGAGTIYTAVAKRRLHITGLVIQNSGNNVAADLLTISLTPENGSAGAVSIWSVNNATTVVGLVMTGLDIPTVSNVTGSVGTVVGATTFTLIGWEEPTEK